MKRLSVMLIAAAIAAAAGSAGALLRDHFTVPIALVGNATDPNHDHAADEAVRAGQIRKNTLLVDSLIGAAMASVLAAGAALMLGGRGGRAAIAGAAGLILGALGGAAGAVLGLAVFKSTAFDPLPDVAEAARIPIVHFVLWLLIGTALAAAFALGVRRQRFLPLLGQLAIAALIASALYPALAGILFPMLDSDRPIPEGTFNTLLWIAIPALLFGIMIHRLNPAPAQVQNTPAGELQQA